MKKKNIISYLLISIFFLIFIYSVVNIIIWYQNVNKNKQIKEVLEKNVKVIKNDKTKEEKYDIDFNKLNEINSETVGYLKVKGTNIRYVVVKGHNNTYYLNHNYYKERNIAGWIFADYQNKVDGSDENLIIYGHNTKNNTMFGSLGKVVGKNWQDNKDNHYITFITNEKTYTYQVFSTYIIKPEEYYLKTSFTNETEFSLFITDLVKRSNYNYGIDLSNTKHIITLSSCLGSGEKRIVLHAALINTEEN